MENAADALKIGFSVAVFMLAFTLLFQTATLARQVAEMMVVESDETRYYEYLEEDVNLVDANGRRIVTLNEVIPTIYKYSIENYGVTIIDNGKIVARFDRDTETFASNWYTRTEEQKDSLVSELNTYVLAPSGASEITRGATGDGLKDLFKKIYRQINTTYHTRADEFDCAWGGYNQLIAQRIDSDLSRKDSLF